MIRCRITERRRYSADLPQGGLEVPCRLTFVGSVKESDKLQRLLDSFCGKDGQLQDDIDTKDSVIEAADQASSSRSVDLHKAESQPATIDLIPDLTASPQKNGLGWIHFLVITSVILVCIWRKVSWMVTNYQIFQ